MRTRALLTSLAVAATIIAPAIGHTTAGATDVAGVPAALIGQHGPTADYASGSLELVGHNDITVDGYLPDGTFTQLPYGNNGGIALIGDCAYVGQWHDYSGTNPIHILDVSNPASPALVGGVPGSNVQGAVAREIRAIDLPGFKMLTVLTFAQYIDSGAGTPEWNSIRFYTFPSGDCRQPVATGLFDLATTGAFRGHEFFQWIDPVHTANGHPRVLEYITTPVNGSDLIVVDGSDPSNPALVGIFASGLPVVSPNEHSGVTGSVSTPAYLGTYTHSISVSPDGKTGFISDWDGGYFTLDTSDFANAVPTPVIKPLGLMSVPLLTGQFGNTHSSVRAPGTNTVVVGDEIYATTDGCPFGWMRTVDIGDATHAPSLLGEFKLAENSSGCSGGLANDRNVDGTQLDGTFTMHNQTVTHDFVLTSWYGGGLRAIDISNPRAPSEVGFFVPKPVDAIGWAPQTSAPAYGHTLATTDDWWVATWSYPIIRNGLIYVSDIRNGLYILRATPGSALETEIGGIKFLEGNSNLDAFAD